MTDMAFKGNVNCTITKLKAGEANVYGEQDTVEISTPAKCGVVRLEVGQEQSSVRVDSSASRAHADEMTAPNARLLFEKTADVAVGDKVTVFGHDLEVLSVFARHQVHGDLDHYQVDLKIWA